MLELSVATPGLSGGPCFCCPPYGFCAPCLRHRQYDVVDEVAENDVVVPIIIVRLARQNIAAETKIMIFRLELERRTVLFAKPILGSVEPKADRIAIIVIVAPAYRLFQPETFGAAVKWKTISPELCSIVDRTLMWRGWPPTRTAFHMSGQRTRCVSIGEPMVM